MRCSIEKMHIFPTNLSGHSEYMTQRHPIQNDQTTLVTIVTHDRERVFAHGPSARECIDTLYRVQQLHVFFIYSFVIMPDHCHVLLKVPSPATMADTIGSFKRNVTMNLARKVLWQSRYHAAYPRDPVEALRYIHFNPVKAGLVDYPEDYPWSSACGRWDITPLSF